MSDQDRPIYTPPYPPLTEGPVPPQGVLRYRTMQEIARGDLDATLVKTGPNPRVAQVTTAAAAKIARNRLKDRLTEEALKRADTVVTPAATAAWNAVNPFGKAAVDVADNVAAAVADDVAAAVAKETAEAVAKEALEAGAKAGAQKGFLATLGSIPLLGAALTLFFAGKEHLEEQRMIDGFEKLDPTCRADDLAIKEAKSENFADTAGDCALAVVGEVPGAGDIISGATQIGKAVKETHKNMTNPGAVRAVMHAQGKIEAGEALDPIRDVLPAMVAAVEDHNPKAAEHLRQMAKIRHEGVLNLCHDVGEQMVEARNAKTPIFQNLDALTERVNGLNMKNYAGCDMQQVLQEIRWQQQLAAQGLSGGARVPGPGPGSALQDMEFYGQLTPPPPVGLPVAQGPKMQR